MHPPASWSPFPPPPPRTRSWVFLAALWWAFELNLLSVDYPKSVFNHFFEMFITSPDATWALLSHTSGLAVFLIIVNIPSKRRWLIFVLLCGVCFLWGLKSLGVRIPRFILLKQTMNPQSGA